MQAAKILILWCIPFWSHHNRIASDRADTDYYPGHGLSGSQLSSFGTHNYCSTLFALKISLIDQTSSCILTYKNMPKLYVGTMCYNTQSFRVKSLCNSTCVSVLHNSTILCQHREVVR